MNNMHIIFISIVIAVSAVLLTYRYIRRRKIKGQFQLASDQPIDKSCLMLMISPCSSIIDKALECLSSHDNLGVCRNHRLGYETLETLGKKLREYSGKRNSSDERLTVYHEYMLEATGKIAETTRHIITTPDNSVSGSYKCEIEIIRENLTRLLQSTDNILRTDDNTEKIKEEISKDKDFIEHTIAVHSKGMTHDDFDDGDPAYSYLMLLYYLRSFVSSFSQVVKNIEINNKPITA